MVEDIPEDAKLSPDAGRAKRAPPTIDLEASDISGETQNANSAAGATDHPKRAVRWLSAASISAGLTSAVTGAVTAALVIAVAWSMGWPGEASPPPPVPQADTTAIDTLTSRIANIEAKTAKPVVAASDPAAAARIDALEKSLGALRSEISALRAQSEKLAADINAAGSTPTASNVSPLPDLAGINARLDQIEQSRAETASQARAPADDVALRRIVVASLLEVGVRQGEPFKTALAAAKSLVPDPDALKPLDDFAMTGVPSAAALSRELLTLVPKLSPPAADNATTGSGIVDRLQSGAAKLVRIERTDAVGNDRGAVVARVTAAALRNDFAEARRELNTLEPADRRAADAWIERANKRDAALAASRKFETEAMAALVKPAP
jgi:hypothetical protein